MKSIRLVNVVKSYNGSERILNGVNLTIPLGKFFALLGPSGCGKTTILRLIGGFESVDSGKIFLDDVDITNLPINERKVNTVFQHYALFPHLNVFDNVAYGLRIKGVDKQIIEDKVIKMLKAVHLEKHINKSINQLSGGQQQRVALARALINEPEVLLLDESLAALDFELREKMLIELIELQDKLKTTFIYVTHDQLEALTVADQMAIMSRNGKIEQIGSPKEIYEFPESSFVAQFVGNTNIIKGVYRTDGADNFIDVKDLGSFLIDIPKPKDWMIDGKQVLLSLRPEKILITKKSVTGFSNFLKGIVESIVYHGWSTQYKVRLQDGSKLQIFEQNEEHFPQEVIDYDNEVFLYWQKENSILLEK